MHTLPDKVKPISGVLIKHKGLFDYEGLYRVMRAWFDTHHYEFHEERYKDKLFTANGTEIEPKWFADRKIDEYLMYKIKVTWHIWEGRDVEVEVEGQKKTLCTGRASISLSGEVYLDYAGIFKSDNKFIKFIGQLFRKLRDRELRSKYVQGLEDEVFMLQTEMKQFLDYLAKGQAYYYTPRITRGNYRRFVGG